MALRAVAVVVLLSLVCAGCGAFGGVKDASEEIIWSEEVDFQDQSGLDAAEQRMARIVYPVDTRLQSLIEAVRTLEPTSGQDADLEGLLAEFSWIRGTATIDADGEVRSSLPREDDPPAAIGDVVSKAEQWEDRELHALYGKDRYGADVVLLKGLYSGASRTGYLVAAFDFSSLMADFPQAEELVAVSRGRVLWPGRYDRASERLAETSWDDRLDGGAWGRRSVGDRVFFWMARYIGQEPFFYAVEVPRDD